jgi:hypothetical protein
MASTMSHTAAMKAAPPRNEPTPPLIKIAAIVTNVAGTKTKTSEKSLHHARLLLRVIHPPHVSFR